MKTIFLKPFWALVCCTAVVEQAQVVAARPKISDNQTSVLTEVAIPPQRSAPSIADIYYPRVNHSSGYVNAFPLLIMLPGGNIPKEQYSKYARRVARYGFVVAVVENTEPPLLSLFAGQIDDAVALIDRLDRAPSSLYQIVDIDKVGLMGHSLGGATSLLAVGGLQINTSSVPPSFQPFSFAPSTKVKAAALYGTTSIPPGGSVPIPTTTAKSVALIAGTLDQKAQLNQVKATFDTITLQNPARKGLIPIAGADHEGLCNDGNVGVNPDLRQQASQSATIIRIADATALFLMREFK